LEVFNAVLDCQCTALLNIGRNYLYNMQQQILPFSTLQKDYICG